MDKINADRMSIYLFHNGTLSTHGIKFFKDYILFFNMKIPVKYSNNENDLKYIFESMKDWESNLKFCELIKIEFNSGIDFYVKLVLVFTKGKGNVLCF